MTDRISRRTVLSALLFLFSCFCLSAFETVGNASWYGGKFQGRRTANGEIFDTNKLTAAHRTLPFGTKVRVTDLESEKTVIVRINDRGPFVDNRIIDLSKAAADIIGLTPRGVGQVRLEIVYRAPEAAFKTIQVAAFGREENARRLRNRLFDAGFSPSIEKTGAGHFRVLLEHLPVAEIESTKEKLSALGISGVLIRSD